MRSSAVFLLFLAACPTTIERVTVPKDPASDHAPIITLSAIPLVPTGPGAIGDVEPGKSEVSSSTSVNVSRGATVMLVGNARSAGGVKTFTIAAARHGMPFVQASAAQDQDAAGTALNTLTIKAPDADPSGTIQLAVSDPIAVTATATNFNGQTTTITVTYTPADLQVALTASPSTIGYQAASSSTLTWSVLYGVPPIKIELSNNVVPGAIQPSGSATIAPTQTTTYYLNATDQKGEKTATATVSVRKPPPPPSVTLSATPNDGYNCLGTADTLHWTVSGCSGTCAVSLTGHGYGYAAAYQLSAANLPTSGSYVVNPGDEIDFTLSATNAFGGNSAPLKLTIADPKYCGGGTQPTWMIFYVAVKASNELVQQCTWLQFPSDSEADAVAQAQAAYGSTYTATAITKDQFDHHEGCP